jgi:hypothetical protein
MRGNHNPTVAEIERKKLEESEQPQQSGLLQLLTVIARIFMVFFGTVILLVALCGFLLIPSLFIFNLAPNITVMDLFNYVHIGACPALFKLFLSLALFLPFMGLLYVAVKALLDFKGKYRIGLLLFLLWIAALIGLAAVSFPALTSYAYWTKEREEVVIDHACDTLHVKVDNKYKHLRNPVLLDVYRENVFSLLWSADSAGQPFLCILPYVEIVHTRDTGAIRIVYTRRAAGRNRYAAQENLENMPLKAVVQDSLLLLEPFIFDRENKWSGELMRVKIYVPQGKAVKLEMPDSRHRKKRISRL